MTDFGLAIVRSGGCLKYLKALILAALGAQSLAAHAESVSYYGLPIAVESRSARLPGFETIVVAGEAALVPSSEAGQWAALRVLKGASSVAPYPCDSGVAVFAKAIENSDVPVMREALHAAGRGALCNAATRESLLSATVTSGSDRERLADFLARDGDLGGQSALLCDAFELSATTTVSSQSIRDYCSQRLVQRVLFGVFERGDLRGARAELKRGIEAFGASDASDGDSLGALASLIQGLEDAADAGDVLRFNQVKQMLIQRAAQFKIRDSAERIDEWFVVRGLEREDIAAVSRFIPGMSFDSRSPRMHEYVFQILSLELATGVDLDSFIAVQGVLSQYAAKDEEIALVYHQRTRSVIERLLEQDRANDAVAVAKASGVELPLPVRFRLVVGSWAGIWEVLAFCVIIPVVCGLGFLRRKNRRIREAFKESRGGGALQSDEYLKALAALGLTPGASIAEVKNAYRREIKHFHPDVDSGKSEEARRRFIELTHQYEYLLSCLARKG